MFNTHDVLFSIDNRLSTITIDLNKNLTSNVFSSFYTKFQIKHLIKILSTLASSKIPTNRLLLKNIMSFDGTGPIIESGHAPLYLEVTPIHRPLKNPFSMTQLYYFHDDVSIVSERSLSAPPSHYLLISNGMIMSEKTSNIVAASFGMDFLTKFQVRAWEESIPVASYSGVEITKESFEKFLKLQTRTRTTHNTNNSTSLELLSDNFFIGLSYNEKKIPHKYTIDAAILYQDFEPEFLSCYEEVIKDLYIEWVDSISEGGHLSTKTIPLPKNEVFYEEAYPCLEDKDLKSFVDDYLNSNSAVLLLYGPPGTGKTSLLKQIMQYANESCLITYNKDIAAMDTLFSHFYDCDERFLIIEDADTYTNSRSKDGNDVMKKLLNITDGLTARREKKVIFTTNLTNLADVDDALTREGRCYSTLHVDSLSVPNANKLLSAMGVQDVTVDPSLRSITLANVYSLVAGRKVNQSTSQVKKGFGFA